MQKTITIQIVGDGAIIDSAIASFAAANRSRFKQPNDDQSEPSDIQVSERAIKSYFRETVEAHNVEAARQAAAIEAVAETQAAIQTLVLTAEVN
jgi:hypothetical protein